MSKILIGGFTLLASVSAIGAWASIGGTHRTENPGVRSVLGTVRVSGAVAAPGILSVDVDPDVCGADPLLDESLLVDPESLGVMNVVIRITSMIDGAPATDRDYPRALQQRNCRYEPHILIVPAGREFSILNWDGILHHTRSSTDQPIDRAQPRLLKRVPVVLKEPEFIEVACDVHDWMNAWIVVAEHRFYVVTGETGEFRLEGVPPGRYQLQIWHETLGSETV